MSDNKFFLQLKGTQTPKSVVEIKNDKLVEPFAGVPHSTDVVGSIIDDKDSSVVVVKGAQNWKLDGSSLVVASSLSGDGADYTGEFNVSGNGLWINAIYSLPATIFSAGTKWVLKLCGKNLLTTSGQTIGFTLIVKIGNTHITSKTFTVVEGANVFCRQLVIDFSESEQTIIKAQSGDSLTVQLLCSDANASATIYNGMTVFTALQRRVDGDVVVSDKKTFDELVEDVEDLEEYVDATFVKKAGDTMTGALNIADIASSNTPLLTLTHSSTATYKWNIAPRYNSTTLSIYPGSTETNGFRFATTGFVPASNNARYLGSASLKWKGVYTGVINNGYDLLVPAKSGTLATKEEVDLAANSGSQLYDTGVWYAKMNSATVVPTGAEYNDRNYADFSQVDRRSGRPVIVIYSCRNGVWDEVETITPPDSYNGYITVTSKIWDIPEQAGQQGGEILWSFERQRFTPYPKIVSFESINVTGNSTVDMPQNPSSSQIVNKDYVDNAITNSGTGRNVGDIFLTMRNDNELNGAVECDGATYNTTDFTGAQSIGQLLSAGKVPYVSLSDYADEITAKGWCDKFGWDGVNTTAFKVPTLNAYIWQKLNTPVVGTGKGLGLVGAETGTWAGRFNGQGNNATDYVIKNTFNVDPGTGGGGDWIGNGAIGVVTDPTKSALTTDTTGNISDQRVMVQLAISATDEALETCTSVLADVAELKYDYVVDFQAPTAANNYTWYRKYKSGWVEQGGTLTYAGSASNYTVNLPVEMADANYQTSVTLYGNTSGHEGSVNGTYFAAWSRTTTSFVTKLYNAQDIQQMWEVKGMSA